MSQTTDARPRERRGTCAAPPQSRILVLQMLAEAGPAGLPTEPLANALLAIGLTTDSAASRLYKDKSAGLIFGKGAYLDGRLGITYRYFETAQQCDAYIFEGVLTPEKIEEKRRARDKQVGYKRWRDRVATETPDERAQRLDANRVRRYAKNGIDEPPPRRPQVSLKNMTPEEFVAHNREKQRESYERQKAKGRVRKRGPSKPDSRPGRQLVARDDSRPAPVKISVRPVLTGPVDMSRARVTVAPVARDYRFWVDPAMVRPVFGAMRPGEYLEEEVAA